MLRSILFSTLFLSCLCGFGQDSGFERFLKPSDTLNQKRQKTVYLSQGSLAALSLVGLNQLWYKDYERSSFHRFRDHVLALRVQYSRTWRNMQMVTVYNLDCRYVA